VLPPRLSDLDGAKLIIYFCCTQICAQLFFKIGQYLTFVYSYAAFLLQFSRACIGVSPLGTDLRKIPREYTFNEFMYFTKFTIGQTGGFQSAKVTELTLPPSLASLGTDFIRSSYIADFVVPRYIHNMGTRNIYYNGRLNNLVLLSDTKVTLGDTAGSLASINLYVPDDLMNEYQADQKWQQMKIHPLSECTLTWPSYYNRESV